MSRRRKPTASEALWAMTPDQSQALVDLARELCASEIERRQPMGIPYMGLFRPNSNVAIGDAMDQVIGLA